MAIIDAPPPTPVKTFVVCDSYAVYRLGRYARAEIRMTQCDYLTTPLQVSEVVAPAGDGSSGTVRVPLLGRSLVGYTLSSGINDELATVTTQIEDTGADVLTLSTPLTSAQLSGPLFVVERMEGIGSTAYRPSPTGRSWVIALDAQTPAALNELMTMLGVVGVTYGTALAQALNTGATQQEIEAAVQSLASQGVQVDALYAQRAEALEAKRRAGNLPYASLMGAP